MRDLNLGAPSSSHVRTTSWILFTVIVMIASSTIITIVKFGISGTNMILLSATYRDLLIMEASRRACSLGG